jgi:hypothetical protein
VKWGAIVPCPECNVGSTGDINLDIAFSDHRMSVSTLTAFGEVVMAIRRVCEDDRRRFWSFIRFVSANHSDILGVQMSLEEAAACDAVLASADPPRVVAEESGQSRYMRELEERSSANGEPEAKADRGNGD